MTTIYGLKNCDTCRKAQNWLKRFGIDYRFVDYRDERQSPDTLVAWKDALGGWEAMVNKSSTTWRELAPNRKAPGSDAEFNNDIVVRFKASERGAAAVLNPRYVVKCTAG